MNARAFLIRGLLAGLLAGLTTFAVAYIAGEPQVDQAIAIEEATSATAPMHDHSHTDEHTHSEGDAVVNRQDQSTWGLATGTVVVSVAIGGVVGLAAAGAMGRIANLSPGISTALVGGIGYVSVVLVPFLKYPATPPGVGDGETIGQRTVLYFTYLLVSLIAAAVCTGLAVKLLEWRGVESSVLIGVATYLVIVVLVGALMPTVNEIGTFPGDVLWSFRRASIITLTTMWATICAALVVLVRRLDAEQATVRARRDFAASL
jgi:putative cobalt transporter subunit CbtA